MFLVVFCLGTNACYNFFKYLIFFKLKIHSSFLTLSIYFNHLHSLFPIFYDVRCVFNLMRYIWVVTNYYYYLNIEYDCRFGIMKKGIVPDMIGINFLCDCSGWIVGWVWMNNNIILCLFRDIWNNQNQIESFVWADNNIKIQSDTFSFFFRYFRLLC